MAEALDLRARTEVSDDDLVARARLGSLPALELLLRRYRPLVRGKARGYFLAGADSEDLEQEGMIGLYKAVRDFRPDRESTFRTFADLCVTRQILTAVKMASRRKHQPLNRYVSLSAPSGGDDADDRAPERLAGLRRVSDPADEVVWAEGLQAMRASMAGVLSPLEVQVLHRYLEGRSYQEIGQELGKHVKCVDNALQRVKRKIEAHLQARDARDAEELARPA